MAHVTKAASPRPMTFNIRAIKGDAPGERWQWTVYDDPHGRLVRDGQITGDREKAERAARAAIAVMGGHTVDDEDG